MSALGYCLQAWTAVCTWFGVMINASGPFTWAVLAALFVFAAVMSLIIMPLRGQAIADMAANEYKSRVSSRGKFASGHMRFLGGRKGKYSK